MAAHHHFVKHAPSRVRHLVKLVNAADTAIAQDESTTEDKDCGASVRVSKSCRGAGWSAPLQHKLLRVRITGDVGRETNSRRSLSRCVDTSRCDLVHILSGHKRHGSVTSGNNMNG